MKEITNCTKQSMDTKIKKKQIILKQFERTQNKLTRFHKIQNHKSKASKLIIYIKMFVTVANDSSK